MEDCYQQVNIPGYNWKEWFILNPLEGESQTGEIKKLTETCSFFKTEKGWMRM